MKIIDYCKTILDKVYEVLHPIFFRVRPIKPKWITISGGLLRGRKFFLAPELGFWHEEIALGIYDHFFFDYLRKFKLRDKTILDIGAHIGYHTLCFAELVGGKGHVYSFEPNKTNIDRMKMNLGKNTDLKGRVKIVAAAISNKNGHISFSYSKEIENGLSTGGYINGSVMPMSESTYKDIGFRKMNVRTFSLNSIKRTLKIKKNIDIVKIDVEGAEYLVIRGSGGLLKSDKPILLIEIHNNFNLIDICKKLATMKYDIKLLSSTENDRCFVVCRPI